MSEYYHQITSWHNSPPLPFSWQPLGGTTGEKKTKCRIGLSSFLTVQHNLQYYCGGICSPGCPSYATILEETIRAPPFPWEEEWGLISSVWDSTLWNSFPTKRNWPSPCWSCCKRAIFRAEFRYWGMQCYAFLAFSSGFWVLWFVYFMGFYDTDFNWRMVIWVGKNFSVLPSLLVV